MRGIIFCHILPMSAAWHVLWWGASFSCHIWLKFAVWHVLRRGANLLFRKNLGGTICLICNTHHSSFIFWMPIAWVSQPTPPTRPLFLRGLISRELPTKFSSSTTSLIKWLGASKPIPYPPLGPSTRDLYAPNIFKSLHQKPSYGLG